MSLRHFLTLYSIKKCFLFALRAVRGRGRRRGDVAEARARVPAAGCHGERGQRSQVLLKLAGAESVVILAVNALAVNGAFHAPYSVKKCLAHSI